MPALPHVQDGTGCAERCNTLCIRKVARKVTSALRERLGVRIDDLDLIQPGARINQEAVMNGNHHLTSDLKARLVDKQVDSKCDGTLEAVLYGNDRLIDFPITCRCDYKRNRVIRDAF